MHEIYVKRPEFCFPLVPLLSHSPYSLQIYFLLHHRGGDIRIVGGGGRGEDEGREGGLVPLQLLVFLYSSIFPISSVQTCVPDT